MKKSLPERTSLLHFPNCSVVLQTGETCQHHHRNYRLLKCHHWYHCLQCHHGITMFFNFPTSHLRRGSNWVIPDSSTLILSSLLFRYFQRIYSVLINWRNLVAIMFYNPIHHQKKWSSWGVPCYKLPFPSPIHHRTKLGNGNFQRCRSSGVERLDELPGLSAEKVMMDKRR